MKDIRAAGNWGVRETPELSGLRKNTIPNPALLILSTGFPRDLQAGCSYKTFRKPKWQKAKKQLP